MPAPIHPTTDVQNGFLYGNGWFVFPLANTAPSIWLCFRPGSPLLAASSAEEACATIDLYPVFPAA